MFIYVWYINIFIQNIYIRIYIPNKFPRLWHNSTLLFITKRIVLYSRYFIVVLAPNSGSSSKKEYNEAASNHHTYKLIIGRRIWCGELCCGAGQDRTTNETKRKTDTGKRSDLVSNIVNLSIVFMEIIIKIIPSFQSAARRNNRRWPFMIYWCIC